MYCDFYGLSERPFELTPDPMFFYESPGHREALASLIYVIQERRGFIAIVGEPGTGKTTLLKALRERLDEDTKVANIFNTHVTFDEMLNMALVDLRVTNPEETLSRVEAIHRLNDFGIEQLFRGANVAILVDEAQNLDLRSMENLRLLSNLETRKRKLIQIVLSGQPELDAKLNQPELRQLAQRISLKTYITPLTEKETQEYIQHRLAIAGCKNPNLFSLKAQHLIWRYSGGVPRKINILCDNSLLIAFGVKEKKIKGHTVEEAIKNLGWSPVLDTGESQATLPVEEKTSKSKAKAFYFKFALALGLGITACLIFILGFFPGNKWFSFQNGESPSPHNPEVASANIPEKKTRSADGETHQGSKRIVKQTKVSSQPRNSSQPSAQAHSGPNGQAGGASKMALARDREKTPESVAIIPRKKPEQTLGTLGAEDKQSWKSLIVKSGDSFSKLVANVYGRSTPSNLKLVRHHNPHIEDFNKIAVGQKIYFPPPYSTQ